MPGLNPKTSKRQRKINSKTRVARDVSTVASRSNTSRQAKACLRNRARIVDVYNQRRRAAKKRRRAMSKAEFRERLSVDIGGKK